VAFRHLDIICRGNLQRWIKQVNGQRTIQGLILIEEQMATMTDGIELVLSVWIKTASFREQNPFRLRSAVHLRRRIYAQHCPNCTTLSNDGGKAYPVFKLQLHTGVRLLEIACTIALPVGS
jgi:hypothetical protein